MNVVAHIRAETRHLAERTAIVEGDRHISYGQLLHRVAELRDRLVALGMGPGQRIGFRCRDGIDHVLGALALLDCGAAVVPLADSLAPDEIAEMTKRMDVHGVLAHATLDDRASAAGELAESFVWKPRSASGLLDGPCRELGAAFVRFSSGTTGASKGVLLSHRTIIERTDAANHGLGITNDDVILWVLGMSHHFVVTILLFLRKGASIVVANADFPFSLLDAAARVRPTFVYASPLHYHLLASVASVPPDALARTRLAVSTATKMPPEIAMAFAQKFGFKPAEAYGIIEVGLPFVNRDAADPAAQGTVGRIIPGYDICIHEPDAGGVGEVLLRGPGMFDAYVSPWQLRDACLFEGWFRTGDLGRVDDQGRLCLMGRSKTVIVTAGMKVFPEEVEATINAVPAVAESLVAAQDHPQLGQVPVAHVVLARGASDPARVIDEIRRHCCLRLSPYKVPASFDVVSTLPKTPSGKLVRRM